MRSARLQAATVIATTAGIPVVDSVVRVLTREPHLEETEIAGLPALVCRPAGAGPWPAAIALNGATPLGNRHRAVQRLACGLGRAGFLAVLPELPGLVEGEIDRRTVAATVAVAEAVATRPEARGGRVALLGVSTGAGLALLAADDDRVRSRVSAVAAVAPFADLRLVLQLATTGVYARDGVLRPYRTVPLLGRVVARSLAAALPRGGRDRELLLAWLPKSGDDDRDPLAPLPAALLAELGADGSAVANLLANRDPLAFGALFDGLPAGVHELVALLSLARRSLRIDAPIELVTAPDDGYFPLGEAEQLAAALPTSRLTVTSALEHVTLRATLGAARDLRGLGGAAIRSLGAASRDPRRSRGTTVSSWVGEPLRFLAVGVAGYLVNVVAFAAAYDAGAAYAAGAVGSYLLSNALMYLGNRYFTFRLGHDGLLTAYLRYVLVGLLVVTLNVALLALLVEGAQIDPRVANAVSLLAVTPVAFGVNKRWTFQLARA